MTRNTVARNSPPPASNPVEMPHARAFSRISEAWTVLEVGALIP
jgi:hypothetical protein